jgi:hypothetical protein
VVRFLAAAWEQVVGLLVEDGQIAIGTIGAFAVAAAWSAFGGPAARDLAGWLLFVLLMALLLVNLYQAGRRAQGR